MFEHFDERARRCVVLAEQEARGLGHEELGTVHLLLGVAAVLDAGGGAARALREAGAPPGGVRERATAAAGTAGSAGAAAPGAGDDPAGDAALLALVLRKDGAVAALLREHGIDEALLREISGSSDPSGPR